MSPEKPRVVLDTSVLISRFLCPQSVPGQAVERAKTEATLLVSEETIAELLAVFAGPNSRNSSIPAMPPPSRKP